MCSLSPATEQEVRVHLSCADFADRSQVKDSMVKNRLSITLPAGCRVLGLPGGPACLNPLINPTDFTGLLMPSELPTFLCAHLDKCLRTSYPELADLKLSLRLAPFVPSLYVSFLFLASQLLLGLDVPESSFFLCLLDLYSFLWRLP